MATVNKVEFYDADGVTKLGEATSAPYTITLNNVTSGNKGFIARAVLSDASTIDSIPVNVTVNPASTVPAYTPEAETTAYLTAVSVPDDGTTLFAGTPQETTGEKFAYDHDKLLKDLKTATGVSELNTVFDAIYTKFGDSYDMTKFNLLNPQDTDSAKRLVYNRGVADYIFNPEGVKVVLANTGNYGQYWKTFVTAANWDDLGHGVITVIGSDNVNIPSGKNNYFFNVGVDNVADPEASGISLYVGDNKTVGGTLNGTNITNIVGEDIRGVYASFKIGTDNIGNQSGLFKNGVRRSTTFGGPFGDNRPNGKVFGGALVNDAGSEPVGFTSSKQLHLSEAYVKAPLTEQQVIDVSNAFADFEGRIGRKTW